jgi:Cu/Ag efflux protein CusF
MMKRDALALLFALSACGGDQADGHYHSRGVIAAISGSGIEAEVSIHHEAIARFKDREGVPSTMNSMTMIFGIAPNVTSESMRIGEPIAFDFEVHWQTRPTLRLTGWHPLPTDTKLTLSANK